MTRLPLLALLALLALLTGCASGPKFTVDDGRPVDETLLAGMRAYGAGERLIRPAIARSAALKDKDCDKQWELPFAVATSAGWSENDRVAWARALQVDERLTVIAVTQDSPLPLGARIDQVGGQASNDGERLLEWLAEARDTGRPFTVGLPGGKGVRVTPFEVCRGYTRLAPPNTPQLQDYHWLLSLHPLEVTQAEPTPDEALWMVLWTQGLSEEGGARMKTYHYALKIGGTLYNLATLASGVKAAAVADTKLPATAKAVKPAAAPKAETPKVAAKPAVKTKAVPVKAAAVKAPQVKPVAPLNVAAAAAPVAPAPVSAAPASPAAVSVPTVVPPVATDTTGDNTSAA